MTAPMGMAISAIKKTNQINVTIKYSIYFMYY